MARANRANEPPADAILAWHFSGPTLRDGRPIPAVGETLSHEGPIEPCGSGLHASRDSYDAMPYAPGATLHRVQVWGDVTVHGEPEDKLAARHRRILWSMDVSDALREFARETALRALVEHGDPERFPEPGDYEMVAAYLATGDEALRFAAHAATHTGYAADAAAYADAAANAGYAASCAADAAANAAAYAAYAAYADERAMQRRQWNTILARALRKAGRDRDGGAA